MAGLFPYCLGGIYVVKMRYEKMLHEEGPVRLHNVGELYSTTWWIVHL